MALVVFLFTDMERSTRRWLEYPEAMGGALVQHDELLVGAVVGNGGAVVKHTGDGIVASFETVRAAVEASVSAQRSVLAADWGVLSSLGVRMAVHAGEAARRGDDWFGPALNRCARLLAVGHGSQVLVSDAARALMVDNPPSGVQMRDLGLHRLRDLPGRERVWQVVAAGLPVEFPPLRAVAEAVGNLPAPLSTFVGRLAEVAEVVSAVAEHRMVTLLGAGGMGKTRLALEAGARLSDRFVDGVWFVDLAPLEEADAIDHTLLAVLDEPALPGLSARQTAIRRLTRQRALLVIDNCEHLVEEAGGLVDELLRGCGEVSVLATSRRTVGVAGGWVVQVEGLSRDDQAQLFRDRTAALGRDVSADDARVAELGQRLDGMPLAIELAAARLRSMSLEELLDGLAQRRLHLADSRSKDRRHRTLRAVTDWSFEQLSVPEQSFFCQLSCFAGEFDLVAAEAVALGVDDADGADLMDSLVEASLIVLVERYGHTGYRLLETLRQYGQDRLEPIERRVIAHRHAEYYASFVERVVATFGSGDADEKMIGPINSVFDNLRSAVRIAVDEADADLALRIVAALRPYAELRGSREVAEWAAAALALSGGDTHPLAARAHLMISMVAHRNADWAAAEQHARLGLALIPDGAHDLVPRLYLSLAEAIGFQGRYEESVVVTREGADLALQHGRLMDRMHGLFNLSYAAIYLGGRPDPADLDELQRLADEAGNPRAMGWARGVAGLAAMLDGRQGCLELLQEAIDATAAGRVAALEGAYRGYFRLAQAGDDPRRSLEGLADALSTYREAAIPFGIRTVLRDYTKFFGALDRHELVAVIDAATSPVNIYPHDTARAVARAREVLGGDDFERALRLGRQISHDELEARVLAELASLGVT